MTKDELIAAMADLPGSAQVLTWDEAIDQPTDTQARLALIYPRSFWVFPGSVQTLKDVTISENAVAAVVIRRAIVGIGEMGDE